MSANTDLYDSQTSTPGHTVYSTTVIGNSLGALPHAEIRLQIVPQMQGATNRPPLPGVEWSLDGGAWHNPQVSWITDVSGLPYWMGPDLAIGTLSTGTHKVEVGFTFATGDLYGAYGANVYVDADKCSAGGDLGTYGSGYVSAAFDGPAPEAGSGGSSGTSGGTKSGSSGTGGTVHSSTPRASAPSSSAPTLTAGATASQAAPGVTGEPVSAPTRALGAQDVAAQNTAAASSLGTYALWSLIVLAAFALGGFAVRRRQLRASVSTVAGTDLTAGSSGDRGDSDGTDGTDGTDGQGPAA
ncbi:hypothetical protein KDL01_03165 [Actinospica durhamensis]|uniref:Uncharacterized protein n=1 Tax=Actinospica durhamensis TaxID=1508375 RepID=A0A941IRF4_9ACTN|nr:hypothetical protein [Actinospica durhamensis]MBR7832241.1 hypothetical protein [Actinospica durhamensis]